ncbi:glycine oxidase ThiO [Gracilibacillus caseinilyticus]|uniref:glycine oxidase n=1 Tax=Gracilibacillus caseinilyticus TaxID=2932256 RepID=A0ABY4ERJ7_9BACI|nr:glycine oxidase ThiO [Gracilibacillus caseinilyticus]UOQ46813.1 glycine oxidase ThiO [Gracilibacillus caseinilyticus]
MNKIVDEIVVGGGVIGASIAYELRKRGHSVLLIEANSIGSGASSAAAGMLGVQMEWQESSPLFQFAKESRALYPYLAEELYEITGIHMQYVKQGALKPIEQEDQIKELQKCADLHQEHGMRAEILRPDQFPEKHVAKDFAAALHCPDEGQVSAPHVTKAFAKAAERSGVHILEHTPVIDVLKEHGKAVGVLTRHGERFYANEVVITSGFQTADMVLTLPKLTPVKGECLSVKSEKVLFHTTLFTEGCYLVPKQGNRVIIGATTKPDETSREVEAGSVSGLLAKASRIVPEIKRASLEKVWSGVRPLTRDGYPYIGEVPEVPHLYIAAGHYRNGILLAPRTATYMADLLENKVDYRSYRHTFKRNIVKGVRL